MSKPITADLDRLVSVYIKIRDKKAALKKEFVEQEAVLEDKMDLLKNHLLSHCEEDNVESVRTKHGTFYRSIKSRYWTNDWEAMSKFIVEHEAVDLFEKRLHQTNVRQFLQDNPESLPPGLNVDSEYTINVRRAK